MKAIENSITQERVREAFGWDHDAGVLIWRVRTTNSVNIGDVAGCKKPNGYLCIRIDDRLYLAHRLIWFHITGKWPPTGLDHIDGDRANNRIENLRLATQGQNLQNQRKARGNNVSSGIIGVSVHGDKFKARIGFKGRTRHIGVFETKEEAFEAYCIEKRRIHPFSML